MAPTYIIDLIHTKTNTRYLLRSREDKGDREGIPHTHLFHR